jgi:pimeloyl-ACP methyl ester carboxylesterase
MPWSGSMLRLLKWLTIGYLASGLLLFVFQRKLIFMPTPETGFAHGSRVEFTVGEQVLFAWAANTDAEQAILYFGGNAESVEYGLEGYRRLFPDHAVYLLAYRGYSGSAGEPTEANLYADALAVFDRLAVTYPRIHLVGRSLGSGVATYVAANREAGRLLLITLFDSLVAVAQQAYPMFPVRFLLFDRFESVERIRAIEEQTMLVVAGQDRIVPPEHARRLAAAFPPQQVEVVVVEGAGHNDVSAYEAFATALSRFL